MSETNLTWCDATDIGLEGKGWSDTPGPYDRLPARAEGVAPDDVWAKSRIPAGLCFHFATDATELHARWTVVGNPIDKPRLTRLAHAGLDFYARSDDGQWRWVTAADPGTEAGTYEKCVIGDLIAPDGLREFRVYLPHFSSITQIEIGVPESATFTPRPPRTDKPIVYYGTSIVMGQHASRPGMTHCNMLGRRLDLPMINLGFGGCGRMEAEVVDLVAELDACLFIIDCLPNMNADMVAERTEPLVRQLRTAHPDTPIMLVAGRHFANGPWRIDNEQQHREKNQTQREAFDRLVAAGVANLHFVDAAHVLGDDGDATTDGSHPTDLGFWRYTELLEPAIRQALRV